MCSHISTVWRHPQDRLVIADRVELSPVLAAMRVSEKAGMGAIRFSLGRGTTTAEIDAVIAKLTALPDVAA